VLEDLEDLQLEVYVARRLRLAAIAHTEARLKEKFISFLSEFNKRFVLLILLSLGVNE
jgi:hypothetical protein